MLQAQGGRQQPHQFCAISRSNAAAFASVMNPLAAALQHNTANGNPPFFRI